MVLHKHFAKHHKRPNTERFLTKRFFTHVNFCVNTVAFTLFLKTHISDYVNRLLVVLRDRKSKMILLVVNNGVVILK